MTGKVDMKKDPEDSRGVYSGTDSKKTDKEVYT